MTVKKSTVFTIADGTTFTQWYHAKSVANLAIKRLALPNGNIWVEYSSHLIKAMCLGERYVSNGTGLYFNQGSWHGSYSDNWHGGIQTQNIDEAAEWVAGAKHPELGYALWYKD